VAEWYERWFGEEYLALYPHRNEADAAAAVTLLERQLTGRLDGRVLDLACGAGRHVGLLRRFGWTVGLDLSPVLLRVARANDPAGPYVRADMRVLPFAGGSFTLVTNLFTSFGYFDSDEQHSRVLHEVYGVLRSTGTFVLDYLNADHVRDNLVECDERELSGRRIEQRRSISSDGRFVVKRILDQADGRTFFERVRLFAPSELGALLREAGFTIDAEFGDYAGAPLSPSSSRAIFFARRP
jgi:SAM-dependent methyltransferase